MWLATESPPPVASTCGEATDVVRTIIKAATDRSIEWARGLPTDRRDRKVSGATHRRNSPFATSSSEALRGGFVPAKRTKEREIPDFPSMFRATFPDSRQFNIRAPGSKVIRTRLLMLVSPDAHASMKGEGKIHRDGFDCNDLQSEDAHQMRKLKPITSVQTIGVYLSTKAKRSVATAVMPSVKAPRGTPSMTIPAGSTSPKENSSF